MLVVLKCVLSWRQTHTKFASKLSTSNPTEIDSITPLENYMAKHAVNLVLVLFAISHEHFVNEANDQRMAYQILTQGGQPSQELQSL